MPRLLANDQVQMAIAALAARQHGTITARQHYRCGLSSATVSAWCRGGRVHRIHRGVYAVGHRGLSIEGEWMAAVLACGEGAALSHRSAAMLWRMLKPASASIHVTVAGSGGRARRRGLIVHRSSVLLPSQTTVRDRIPVTKPPRTLEDLRHTASRGEYRRALRQAEFLGLPSGDAIGADRTRSGLERRFLAFCRRQRLPTPEVNEPIGPYTADFVWRGEGVVVETDSFRTHGGPVAFEEDRTRDMWLAAHGYAVVRVTDRQLDEDPRGVAQALRSILGLASYHGQVETSRQ